MLVSLPLEMGHYCKTKLRAWDLAGSWWNNIFHAESLEHFEAVHRNGQLPERHNDKGGSWCQRFVLDLCCILYVVPSSGVCWQLVGSRECFFKAVLVDVTSSLKDAKQAWYIEVGTTLFELNNDLSCAIDWRILSRSMWPVKRKIQFDQGPQRSLR